VTIELDRPKILGVAVSLLSFGIMFFFLAFLIVGAIYGPNWNEIAFLVLEVVASVLTTVGAGLLVYGAAMNRSP
jgi:hypothetical protein